MAKNQPRTKGTSDVKASELARQYKGGSSLQKIAAENRCNIKTITKRLRDFGVKIRKSGAYPGVSTNGKLTVREREKMRADIGSLKFRFLAKIAEKYGVSRECVRQNAEAIGVTHYRNKKRKKPGKSRNGK
jgi:hypothetical protein